MRTLVFLAVVVVWGMSPAQSAALPTVATSLAVAAPPTPTLGATLSACQSGTTPAERFAVFVGSMPARKGADRMALRFVLRERTVGASAFQRLAVPALAGWKSAKPRARGFVYNARVDALRVGAEYRVEVRFRWTRGGQVVTRATRTSALCSQPDTRPDFNVGLAGVAPGELAGTTVYTVTVRNTGSGPATGFAVTVAPGPRAEASRAFVSGLEAGESAQVELVAPSCLASGFYTLTVDADATVSETQEDNNVVTRRCPSGVDP